MTRFFVPGIPAQAGSRDTIAFRRGDGSLGVKSKPACKRVGNWTAAVRLAADAAHAGPMFADAVEVWVRFVFPRPKSHHRKNGRLKPAAPGWVAKTPDLDKLLRALLDGMTGIVFGDDRQVALISAMQVYELPGAWRVGAEVAVSEIDGPPAVPRDRRVEERCAANGTLFEGLAE